VTWIALHFPLLALEARPGREAEPRVVVENRIVVLASATAQAGGIRSGMSLATARALVPSLDVIEHSSLQVDQLLGELAPRLATVTSQVVLSHDLPGLVGEVGASERLFGGVVGVREAVARAFADTAITWHEAVAPTPMAAEVFAVAAPGALVTGRERLHELLGHLPVEALPLPVSVVTALQRMGVRRAGEVFALPRAGLARRFGNSILVLLDQLLGDRVDPRAAWQAPVEFERHVAWDFAAPTAESLMFPMRRLLGDLAAHVGMLGVRATTWTLVLAHEDAQPTVLEIGSAIGAADADALLLLTHERLLRTTWAGPVRGISLRLVSTRAAPAASRTLFPGPQEAAERADALIERLRARLGDGAVHGMSAVADPRPERAQRRGGAGATRAVVARTPRRPVWLLAVPRPWHAGADQLLVGPERIEGGWWDGPDARRDYFRAVGAAGETVWVYQDLRTGDWYLHGLFG